MPHKLLPKSGGWVKINRLIPTEKPVHRFGIYYAIPTGKYFWERELELSNYMVPNERTHNLSWLLKTFGSEDNLKKSIANWKRNPHHEFTEEERQELTNIGDEELEQFYGLEMQVKIMTEYGNISIQPYEYSIVTEKDLKEYFEQTKKEHAFVQYISKSKQLKGKIADQVFYLRSRGISISNAIQMCIGEVKSANLLYLYMHPGYVEHFTRAEEFKGYVNKHITSMRSAGLEEEAKNYLEQVNQIEGYERFTVD